MNSDINLSSYKNQEPSSSLYEWFDSIIKALIIILILLTFIFRVCTVVGDSMIDTLHDGEQLVIYNFLYTPKENDIIVFHQTGDYLNEPCVKRVIATGDKYVRIDYNNGTLFVSDDEIFTDEDIIDESSYAYFDSGEYDAGGVYEVYVPEGHLFVMGDNRNNSLDSRSELMGVIDEKTVLGKVLLRISPKDKFGIIN